MIRSLLFTTALIGVASSAMAQTAYTSGGYAPLQGTVTLGPPLASYSAPRIETLGIPQAVTNHDQMSSTIVGGQYDVIEPAPVVLPAPPAPIPASTVQTITATPGTPQTLTIPAGQDATYNIVVPSQAAPEVRYAPAPEPLYAPAAAGWKARGVYIGARAGITSTKDNDFNLGRRAGYPGVNIRTAYDNPGYSGALVVGYGARDKSGWGYRVELEGGYQTASVKSHTIEGVGRFRSTAKGDASVLYGFVNTYGDLALTDRVSLTAGGGVGVGRVSFDDYGVGGPSVLDDSATAFGYHIGGGVSYQLTDNVALEALYRYQQFLDAEVTTAEGNEEKIDVENHSVLIGARVGL